MILRPAGRWRGTDESGSAGYQYSVSPSAGISDRISVGFILSFLLRGPPWASVGAASRAQIGLAHALVLQQVRCLALQHHASRLEHVGPVGEAERLGRVLLDQEDGDALPGQRRDDVED